MSGQTRTCIHCKTKYSVMYRVRSTPVCVECCKENKRKYARQYYHEVRKKVLKKRKNSKKAYQNATEDKKERMKKTHAAYEHKKYFETKERVLKEISEGKVTMFPCALCFKKFKHEQLTHCNHARLGKTFLCKECFAKEKNYGVNL